MHWIPETDVQGESKAENLNGKGKEDLITGGERERERERERKIESQLGEKEK
jgi:hypothetical protein